MRSGPRMFDGSFDIELEQRQSIIVDDHKVE